MQTIRGNSLLRDMKTMKSLLAVFAIVMLVVAGCKKEAPPTATVNGVTVDLPKLQQTFATAPQDLIVLVNQVGFGIRYNDYVKALSALDQLANNPNVTEPQKKVVNEVIEQVKKLAGAGATDAAPAQPAQ